MQKHLFLKHSDVELEGSYGRNLDNILSGKTITRFREMLLKVIAHGHFYGAVNTLLSSKDKFNHRDLNFEDDIKFEPDEGNKKKRIDWYMEKRQLILRLAESMDPSEENYANLI